MTIRRKTRVIATLLRYSAALLLVLFVVAPMLWMLSASFMQRTEVFSVPIHWLPSSPSLRAYTTLFQKQSFLLYYFNSLLVAVIASVANTFFGSLVGLAVSNKYNYMGKNLAFSLFLGTMMLPFQLVMIPLYMMIRNVGLLNTRLGVILPGIMSAFGVFLLRQSINDLPHEYFDAARMDGASEFGIFRRIVLPLCRPVIAALFVFTFISSWNDYLWPLVVINEERLRTLTLAVAYMQGFYSTDYPLVLAATAISSIPIVIVFSFSQRFFIKSITMTALKG